MDLFLKFESEEQAHPFLFNDFIEYKDENGVIVGSIVNEEGNVVAPEGATPVVTRTPKFANLDIIGDIYKPTGENEKVTTALGDEREVPVMEKLDGYHVNVRLVAGEDASALQEFSVVPANPVRVWA